MADVQVLVGIKDMNFTDQAKCWIPTKLPALPAPGDTLVIRHGSGEWTAKVVSRTIRDSDSEDPNIVIDCEGRFRSS